MKKKHFFLLILLIIVSWTIVPEQLVIPVRNASTKDWHPQSFWYSPWGKSGVHKGIDIFASKGTDVLAATNGITLFKGQLSLGGNVLIILGPKWRLHYYAHLETHTAETIVFSKEKIGTVGNTGNAKNTPPHLHYAIVSLFPYFWRWDHSPQGWKKMFYLNPGKLLTQSHR